MPVQPRWPPMQMSPTPPRADQDETDAADIRSMLGLPAAAKDAAARAYESSLFLRTLGPTAAPAALMPGISSWLRDMEAKLWRQGLTIEVIRGLDAIGPSVGLSRDDDLISVALQAGIAYHNGIWMVKS